MNGRTPQQLKSFLGKHFDLSELRQLAFDLGIDHEELESKNKSELIISLIQYVQRHRSLQTLEIAAEKAQAKRSKLERKVPMRERNFGTKIGIFSIIVTILGIIVTLASFIPGCQGGQNGNSTPTPNDRVLLQVRVQSSEDQTAVSNVKVSIDYSDALFPEERTDSLGRAVFNLPAKAVNQEIKIMITYKEQVETQNITVRMDMPTVLFEIRP
ncbi:MAG: hypothetical protein H6653_12420 [Ardenticatenaceae bacterium]|nr:hypothetical protein [Ardenticatenaceae bacterium]